MGERLGGARPTPGTTEEQPMARIVSARRLPRRRAAALIAVVSLALLSAAAANRGYAGGAAGPQKGGTLRLLGQSDIFNLDTTSGYYTVDNILERAFTRQLLSYRAVADFAQSIRLVPDVATAVPTQANGGISADGKTYTLHIKQGVKWATSPPRQVTAGDFVREFKLLCNPASPTGAPGYFTSTIIGMKTYCDGFAKVKPTVAGIAAYVNKHPLPGVVAKNDLTLVLKLTAPAPDLPNILAMGFASARPAEYMKYVPDSAQMRQHTISDGPYSITRYVPTKEFTLERNPAWDPKTDTLRKAYVDKITVTEGLTADNVQQQLEAGTADMEWDLTTPPQDLPRLISAKDNRLIIGPNGNAAVALNYEALNQYKGPMTNKLVRQAVEYGIDKNALVQILGGPRIAAPTAQVVLPGNVGYLKSFDPYPDKNGSGDPDKAKQLLKQAGYGNGLAITLLHSTSDPAPRIAQSIQASLDKAGFKVKLLPVTQSDFYGKYLLNIDTAKRGVWDIATPGWIPDWFGNNGRSVIQPLFTSPGPGASDYAGYNSPKTNTLVDKALTAKSQELAAKYWSLANAQIVNDAATVPLNVQKWTVYHSSHVQGCTFWFFDLNCDPTNVWLTK
jgi:peptide/nickel transport system substrate-binding protein